MLMQSNVIYRKPKFKFRVQLDAHPDAKPNCDPRKVWLYDSEITDWDSADAPGEHWSSKPVRLYSFGYEEDMMVFMLRWGGKNV